MQLPKSPLILNLRSMRSKAAGGLWQNMSVLILSRGLAVISTWYRCILIPGAAESVWAVNAQAITVGQNVVLGPGQFNPILSTGKRLLSHELTNVMQQDNGRSGSIVQRWKLKSNEKCLIASVDRAWIEKQENY